MTPGMAASATGLSALFAGRAPRLRRFREPPEVEDEPSGEGPRPSPQRLDGLRTRWADRRKKADPTPVPTAY